MGEIGFVNIGHADYAEEAVFELAARAVDALQNEGLTIRVTDELVTTMEEGEQAGRTLAAAGVDGVILFLGSWLECPVAMSVLREVEHLPLCLWGVPMFERDGALTSTGSYVSFAMFKGTMDRVGYRFKPLLGTPDDRGIQQAAADFCRAASACQRLKRSKVGLFGYTSMGIYPGTFDHVFMRAKIGPEIDQLDSYSLIHRAEACAPETLAAAASHLRSCARVAPEVSEDSLRKAGGIYAALLQLCRERRWDAVNIRCQYEFSKEYRMVPCVPLAALAETGVVASCEGDILNTVSMLILSLLTGQTVGYGDAMHHSGDTLKLSSCGFAPFSMGIDGCQEISNFMPHPGFAGIQNRFVFRPGRVTVLRLVEDRCDYHLLYCTGEGLPTALRQGYMPALDVALDGSVERLTEQYAGQHFALCYGDISARLEDLARILGIAAVRV